MTSQNRARRAAKQRQRDARRAQQQPRERPGMFEGVQDLALDLAAAARATLAGNTSAAEEAAFVAVTSVEPRRAQQIMVDLLADCLTHTWRGGWQPVDLHEITMRKLSREHAAVLAGVTASAMAPFAKDTVHPAWLAQIHGQQTDRPLASTGRLDVAWSVTVAIQLLALLMGLPTIELLLPLPGSYRPGSSASEGDIDQKVLAKVRGLLAKAESTEFDEEAELLSAKAQELMTRYSLDRLLVEAGQQPPVAGGRRIWLESPYASAKALLAAAVGGANRCSVVWTEALGYVTVIGDERDLVATEVVVTSLLVQAGRAMAHGSVRAGGQKRSYRQSFLVAYAQRVGERLQDTSEHVAAEVGSAALVPVRAAQDERVERAREAMFPRTTSRSVAVSNYQGYAEGRAAADQATLHGSAQLPTTGT